MEKRIIVDFDNTMGVSGCDVDDGLALLFLLGTDGAKVEAACTCYGNNRIDVVHENTLSLFGEWGLDLPVYRGVGSRDEEGGDAARFLAQAAAATPGEITLIATGSMTNLKNAALIDPSFFSNLREIAIMGGIEKSLVINGRIMDELNLSCDPAATRAVLAAPCPVTVASSQACLPAFFRREDFEGGFGADSWLVRTCDYWFADMDDRYVWNGFTCWDIVAAAAVMRPDLFDFEEVDVTLYERLLSVGYLERAAADAPSARIRIPRIRDAREFVSESICAWQRALDRLGIS